MSVFAALVAETVNFVFILNDVMRIDLFMFPSRKSRKHQNFTIFCSVTLTETYKDNT